MEVLPLFWLNQRAWCCCSTSMDGGGQLSQLITAHSHRGEGHKGVLPPWVVLLTLSLLA